MTARLDPEHRSKLRWLANLIGRPDLIVPARGLIPLGTVEGLRVVYAIRTGRLTFTRRRRIVGSASLSRGGQICMRRGMLRWFRDRARRLHVQRELEWRLVEHLVDVMWPAIRRERQETAA